MKAPKHNTKPDNMTHIVTLFKENDKEKHRLVLGLWWKHSFNIDNYIKVWRVLLLSHPSSKATEVPGKIKVGVRSNISASKLF